MADHAVLRANGALARLRADQAAAWLWDEIGAGLTERFRADPGVADDLADLEAAVRAGTTAPTAAAEQLLDRFTRR